MLDDTRTEPLYNKQNNRPGLQGYLVTGTVLSGRYKIDGILGHGGFGITYKAWDTVLENYVAIKEYYPASIANRGADGKSISVMTQNDQKEFEEGVERFLREARDVSKFNSYSNIVSIHDFFKENSTAYMVMEYLEGQTLKEYMDSKSVIDESFQLHIAFSVLEVLETIHKKGLVHRDISPDNIFICNNLNIKLIDFGAAKNDTQNDVKTVSVVLKKGYAPIEQYSAKSIVSPKIDIYAFGATMYYLLTGVVPVPSVDRVINDELKEPKMLNPNISDEWNKVILKCMEIKADDRYSSVEEIRQDLMGKGKKEEEKKTEGKKTEDSKPQEKKEEDKKTEEKIIKEPAQERIFKDLDEDVKNNITVNNAKKNMSIVIKLVAALIIACFVIVAIFIPKGKNKKSNKTTATEATTTEQAKTEATTTEKQTTTEEVVEEEKKKANELDARPDESDADYHIEVSEDVGYFSGGASLLGGSYKGIVDKLEIDMEPMSIDRFNEIYGDLTADLFVDDLINDYGNDIEIYINQYYEGGFLMFFFYDNKLLECAYISKAKNVYPDGIVYAAESEFGEQSQISRNYSIFEFDTSCYFKSYLFEEPKTFIEYYIQAYEMTDLSSFSGIKVMDNKFLYVDDSLFGKNYFGFVDKTGIEIDKISSERLIDVYGTVLNGDIYYVGDFYRNDHYEDGIIILQFVDSKLNRVWFLKNVNSIQIDELLASCKKIFNSEPESIDNDNVTASFKKDNISYSYYTAYDDLTNKYYFIQNYTYSE